MSTSEGFLELVRSHGLLILFPLALIEGPIITVIAGWLVRLQQLNAGMVILVCIAADLCGDMLMYTIGRSGHSLPARIRQRFSRHDPGALALQAHFTVHGGRTLLIGKWTHSMGFAVLLAAGAARMPVPAFLWFNLLATIPKTLLLLALGWWLGEAWRSIESGIAFASVLVFVTGVLLAGCWLLRLRRQRRP